MTSAVYPISGNKVISLIPSQMGGGLIEKNLDFYKAGCNEKKDIIELGKADFILSKTIIECDYLNEIYSDGTLIYSINFI